MSRVLPRLLVATATLLFAASASAQQPNTPNVASLTFAGVDGPTYPNIVQWSSVVMGMEVQARRGTPYAILAAGPTLAGGGLSPTGIPVPGVTGLVDIDVATAAPLIVINGFLPATLWDFLGVMGPGGTSTWTLPIGSDGRLGTFQGFCVDPTAMTGLRATAASQVDVTAAQAGIMSVGTGADDVNFNIPLLFGSTIFYDQAYTQLFVNSNGSVTFGGGDADPAVSAAKFDSGFPRMAPLWTNLADAATVGGAALLGSFTENRDGWTVTWTVRDHYTDPAAGPSAPTGGPGTSTYSLAYNYTANVTAYNPTGVAGSIVFDWTIGDSLLAGAPGALVADWGHMGITPGGMTPASPATPMTSTPFDPSPTTFDPAVTPSSAPANGAGVFNGTRLGSYRADFAAATPSSLATIGGSGQQVVFEPLVFNQVVGMELANTYILR